MNNNSIEECAKKLDKILSASQDHHQFIEKNNWPELDKALKIRQKKLSILFKENPKIADNPIIAEKIHQLLELDESNIKAIELQRINSSAEVGNLKRNAKSVKKYISINQESNT